MSATSGLMIETRDLRVDYGDFTAVRDVNLRIGEGEIFGLIGPNGAGKTSTIKVLATLLQPTYGEVFVGGFDIEENRQNVHSILGYMPDFPPVYSDLKVWEFLDLFAEAYFLKEATRRKKIDELIAKVSLQEKRDVKCGELSRGLTQRLLLAKTLLHDPRVLLLDEPASGLDPHARIELRETLKTLAKDGITTLISSHILTELAGFCTSIGIMQRGRLEESGSIDEIVGRMQKFRTVVIEPLQNAAGVSSLLQEIAAVKSSKVVDGQMLLDFDGGDDDMAQLLAHLVSNGVAIKAFYERKMDVEDVFMEIGAREVS